MTICCSGGVCAPSPVVRSSLRLEQIISICWPCHVLNGVTWVLSRTNSFGAISLGWLECIFWVRQDQYTSHTMIIFTLWLVRRQKNCTPCQQWEHAKNDYKKSYSFTYVLLLKNDTCCLHHACNDGVKWKMILAPQ
jgi:hypothetical protein